MFSIVPNSCLLFSICWAYADCRLLFLMYLNVFVVSITYSECISVALVIQHAKRMYHTILSSVAYLAVPYLQHYFIHVKTLGGDIEHEMWFNILYYFCLKHFLFYGKFTEIS